MAEEILISAYELRSNLAGFRALGDLHHNLSEYSGTQIEINCGRLNWMDAHLGSPLQTILQHSRRRGNKHSLTNLDDSIRTILRKNHTLKISHPDTNHTTMPVTYFALDEEVDFANYTRLHMARREMPKMSTALQGKFYEGIDELFANCSLHSRSETKIVVCGQFFPRIEKLAFTISDGGVGIEGSLQRAGFKFESASLAIDWAMQPKNTSRHGDIPGGLGLRLLREFVEANDGKLTVASTEGFWIQSGDRIVTKPLRRPFPGTSVILEINTSDKKQYGLKEKTDPLNIW
ncbi:ATP-binding protein [Agrobacterium tumefaciens]|uniref:ATP-binding protein n=1 Tax=Agrobacterium tumefaciens TaxID=358 RepID=UPI0011467AF7|nr:ATP-binding protein [Agrobacterium tumefaciens]NSL22851.1 ATP-binding protein [Agrobacterium tumefaciens]NTC56762.1 ATP-binding protein [Agrobacterium tumefaciens]NTC62584.1 ATP-binding protein [Agrobacterium tumefaciens]NTC66314.1 ATP-binding protein [Agrobacterium tumefaciens]NTC74894.1 ATP-binding protein [Agrobacterium tumefaciens]